jgi:hypothetical protein
MPGNSMKENHMDSGRTAAEIPGKKMSVTGSLSEAGLPDNDRLVAGLESVLGAQGLLAGKLAIVSRHENTYSSTFPSEIITCRIGTGPAIRFFLKYAADRENEAYGHRSGVDYETRVYTRLLNRMDISIARSYGAFRTADGMNTCLVLDYLDTGDRVTKAGDPEAMVKTARWIGRFHALCSDRIDDPALSFLGRYGHDYYSGWVSRTQQRIRGAGMDPGWLRTVCRRMDTVIEVLCTSPQTIIHGEYYPKNILLQDGMIYPVDWESTAIGNGMVDLATLTEGWTPEVRRELEREYLHARWPEGASPEFAGSLAAARIYVQFRWLGDPLARLPGWDCYLDALREHAEEMGLI